MKSCVISTSILDKDDSLEMKGVLVRFIHGCLSCEDECLYPGIYCSVVDDDQDLCDCGCHSGTDDSEEEAGFSFLGDELTRLKNEVMISMDQDIREMMDNPDEEISLEEEINEYIEERKDEAIDYRDMCYDSVETLEGLTAIHAPEVVEEILVEKTTFRKTKLGLEDEIGRMVNTLRGMDEDTFEVYLSDVPFDKEKELWFNFIEMYCPCNSFFSKEVSRVEDLPLMWTDDEEMMTKGVVWEALYDRIQSISSMYDNFLDRCEKYLNVPPYVLLDMHYERSEEMEDDSEFYSQVFEPQPIRPNRV